MAFVKGKPKTGGRSPKTPNITTREAHNILNQILFSQIKKAETALNEVYDQDKAKYLEILCKLLHYSLPKRTDLTSDDQPLKAGILGMTREQIEKELEQWKKV